MVNHRAESAVSDCLGNNQFGVTSLRQIEFFFDISERDFCVRKTDSFQPSFNDNLMQSLNDIVEFICKENGFVPGNDFLELHEVAFDHCANNPIIGEQGILELALSEDVSIGNVA